MCFQVWYRGEVPKQGYLQSAAPGQKRLASLSGEVSAMVVVCGAAYSTEVNVFVRCSYINGTTVVCTIWHHLECMWLGEGVGWLAVWLSLCR